MSNKNFNIDISDTDIDIQSFIGIDASMQLFYETPGRRPNIFSSDERFEVLTTISTASRLALGPTQPPIQWVPGDFPIGIKRPGREANHSPPSTAEVKNAWSYTSTPPIRLHDVVLNLKKSQGQLYLLQRLIFMFRYLGL
jgi:hypothetical protein